MEAAVYINPMTILVHGKSGRLHCDRIGIHSTLKFTFWDFSWCNVHIVSDNLYQKTTFFFTLRSIGTNILACVLLFATQYVHCSIIKFCSNFNFSSESEESDSTSESELENEERVSSTYIDPGVEVPAEIDSSSRSWLYRRSRTPSPKEEDKSKEKGKKKRRCVTCTCTCSCFQKCIN